MTPRRPNVLIVLADQLRACSVGYAGEEPVVTPHLDRLEAESANLVTAVSPTPVCTPYRGSLITGRTALSLGLVLNDIPLRTTEVSLAHAFAKEGYDTGYIGKWHLNGADRLAWIPPGAARQGFDFWAGANFDHNYDRSIYFAGDSPEPQTWKGYDAESQTTLAIDYMKDHAKAAKPFCLVLSWGPPHHPYRTVPKEYLERYDAAAIRPRPNCPNAPREDLRGYYAQTTFLDDQVARLVAALEELAMKEDTIVVFTSDHGDMHGSHGVYKKQWPWDESIKVPFLLRYPRKVKARRHDFPLSAIDIMPTVLGMAGIGIPKEVEGVDLSPFIRGERSDAPAAVLLMNPCPFSIGDPRGPDQVPAYEGMRMEYRGVRTARHTYVRTIDKPWLLYDNVEDPYQLRNLIADASHCGLIAKLEAQMQSLMGAIGDTFLPKEEYYRQFDIQLDHRGKVKGIVENPYDRLG